MKIPKKYEPKSDCNINLFDPFEEWDDHGQYFGLCMDGPTILDQTELDEDDEFTHEWHITYYGGGIWEIEYSKASELCTVVYRGKIPTREVFLTVMANVEDAPNWAIRIETNRHSTN